MRIPYLLVGLVSLASLAFAAPALPDSPPLDTVAIVQRDPPHGTVWACTKTTSEVGGVCGSREAFKHCEALPDAIGGQVRWLKQNEGYICTYFGDKGCKRSTFLFSKYSREGVYAEDIAENIGKKIFGVWCDDPIKKAGGSRGLVRYPIKKAGGSVENTAASTMYQARSAPKVSAPIDVASISALASPGDVVVCQNKLDNGPCETVRAQDRCVTLGNEVSHKVRTIYQAAGSVCKYFESDCSTPHPVVSVNSRTKPLFVQLDKPVGERIGLVLCRNDWPSAELEAGSTRLEPRDVEATTSILSTTPSRRLAVSSTLTTRAFDKTKSARSETLAQPLYICDLPNLGGRCTFYESPACLNHPFQPNFIQSLRIKAWYQCAFYHQLDCKANISPPNYETATGEDKIMGNVPYKIWSMSCYVAPISSNIEAERSINGRRGEGPGDTRICDAAYFQSCKDNVNAMDRCSSFDPTAGGPNSLIQFQGAFCKWYRGYGCARESKDDEPMAVDSRAQTIEIGDLGPDNNRFKSVECRGEPF